MEKTVVQINLSRLLTKCQIYKVYEKHTNIIFPNKKFNLTIDADTHIDKSSLQEILSLIPPL